MTHVTIKRAKLEQMLKVLKSTSGLPHWPAIFATVDEIEQALAAPVQDQFRDATKMIVAGNKLASIINTAITAPVNEWPTTYELDVVIKEWKQATTEESSAVAAPVQEPLAWLDLSKMSDKGMVYATGFQVSDKQSALCLCTPPAAQPAVPLTDDQTTDKDRLDWLNNNFFNRENIDWLTGNVSKESLMWVFFAPTKVQGDIRRVIDAAMDRDNGITAAPEKGGA
jgi:hypothetical protein